MLQWQAPATQGQRWRLNTMQSVKPGLNRTEEYMRIVDPFYWRRWRGDVGVAHGACF